MEHESPIMKAWREFALADPEDCEREYDAYITLVNRKAAVSGSSPTNSTSSLHHRAPAAAVTAPSTTRSTAPLSAPSNAMSSTAVSEESASRWDQDDVYPPLAELRRALMTDAEWAAMSEWEKDLWEMKHLPEEERMKSIEGVVMWLPAAQQDQRRKEILEEILRFGEPAPTLNSSRAPASTTDTSLVLPVAIELDVVQDAVDDQAAPTPTNCSSECPSKDAYTSVSVSISSATPNSSTTTGGIVPKLAAPELSDKALDVDVTALNHPPRNSPRLSLVTLIVTTGTAIVPWPPPSYVRSQEGNMCKDMLQALLLDDFVLWSMQLMLWAGKYRWPPPTPIRSTCCRILNLHSTLDKDMQLSGDCQVLKICELKCSTVPIVVTFVPGYQKAQLKPTQSKWLIPSCLGRKLLGSSTLDFLLARRAAHIVWNWCCFDYLHYYLDSTNCALQEEHRQALLQIHWQSVGYHWEAAYRMKPCSAIHKLFIIEHWLIPWEPGDGSPGRNHMENLTSLVTTGVLLYSISLDDKLLIGRYWLWWMKCVELPGVRPGAYFSLPGVNKGKLKWYSIFYASNSCWNGWHSLWLLIHWLHMPCLQLFWGLLCAVQGHVCSSTSVFLAKLNGESEVQHQYACTRVLTVTVGTVWIYHYIVGGNTHYSVLMQCSISHPKLQSEFRFYTAGHILFFCCALVQWKIPWTICLVSLRYWFQCCHAACESWEEFYSSIQIGKLPGLLVQLVQLKPWPSCELFSCIAAVIRCLLGAFHIFTSSVFILKDIYFRSTHYLEVCNLDAVFARLRTLTALHAGELYWILRLHSSCAQFVTKGATTFDSQYFEWQIPWYICPCSAVSRINCLLVCIKDGAQLCYYSHYIDVLLDRVPVSHRYHHDPAHLPFQALQFPWDPGECFASVWRQGNPGRMDDQCPCLGIDKSKVPWDPGGSSRDRLGGKPNFKRGGLSATSLHSLLGWLGGPPPWARACLEHPYMRIRAARRDWLGTGRLRPPLLRFPSSPSLVPLLVHL